MATAAEIDKIVALTIQTLHINTAECAMNTSDKLADVVTTIIAPKKQQNMQAHVKFETMVNATTDNICVTISAKWHKHMGFSLHCHMTRQNVATRVALADQPCDNNETQNLVLLIKLIILLNYKYAISYIFII